MRAFVAKEIAFLLDIHCYLHFWVVFLNRSNCAFDDCTAESRTYTTASPFPQPTVYKKVSGTKLFLQIKQKYHQKAFASKESPFLMLYLLSSTFYLPRNTVKVLTSRPFFAWKAQVKALHLSGACCGFWWLRLEVSSAPNSAPQVRTWQRVSASLCAGFVWGTLAPLVSVAVGFVGLLEVIWRLLWESPFKGDQGRGFDYMSIKKWGRSLECLMDFYFFPAK